MTQPQDTPDGSLTLLVGGAGRIGRAIAERLIDKGRRVVVLDLHPAELDGVAFIETDIRSDASVAEALDLVARRHGSVDALICAAGYLSGGNVLELTEDDIARHFEVNLLGAVRVSQKVAAGMRETGGKILFISSIHGQIGVPNRAAYAMSKAALGAWSRAMAVELAPHRIRVNVLAPGAVDTGGMHDPAQRAFWQAETPSGRVAKVEEIARFAALLTSDEASFMTGQTIAVDGGASNLRPQGLSPSPGPVARLGA
ncbi:SDR family NAD(P)-dependent oxidoreductase [Vannielia litorea]|uniref:3-oxoacyl-[acyl-carrier protein] reductase/2-keto-3-deoxy-L-fuconate dehydrogenase n=1 Tax=Vannielia litorea TaxID=1217970 RepID=A0A1N6FXA6_9RHOB|nr:SDR family oxidoreductase [Vannielia litorea]SIN99904.1 3-oxoacyl-[acyl-carrier protein] reductase/2-keto-3-deoxy-L-fuconate dehydrogenase [Vannielia litorea]